MSVTNKDTVPHTVDVVVLHDGEVVYWTTEHVEARLPANETNFTFDIVHSARVHPPVIENTTRRYEVLVRLDDRTDGVRYVLAEERLNDCYGIGARIVDGRLHGPVIHHWNDKYCLEPENRSTLRDDWRPLTPLDG